MRLDIPLSFFWCWRPGDVWNVALNQETALPCARLKEDDELHPQGYPHMRGQLQNNLGEKCAISLAAKAGIMQLRFH